MPLSEPALRRALERIGAEAPVRFDEVTRSTQLTARELAEEGAPEWTLVAAGHQTEGRGRLGREWVDVPGATLLFSLLLRPALPPERGGLISLLGGWATATACRRVSGAEAGCTWPNDVVVGGGKVGGILAESELDGERIRHVILGVGVNLAASPAVAGAAALGDADPAEVLEVFLEGFASAYRPAEEGFAAETVAAYRSVCVTIGATVRATTTRGESVEGEAEDLDETGGLVVRTDRGLEVVRFGEVEHLR